MSDITSIAPYEPVTIQDTTDENRTDLVALLQRQENEIALQNQVIRQFLEHWDSISRINIDRTLSLAEISANSKSSQHIILTTESSMGKIALATEVARNRLVLYDMTHNIELNTWTAD